MIFVLNRKLLIWIVIAILSLAAIIASCIHLFNNDSAMSQAKYYERNWGITLPSNMEMEFHKSTKGTFGHAIQYSVFELVEFPQGLFTVDTRYTGTVEVYKALFDEMLYNAESEIYKMIPQEYLPDWNNVTELVVTYKAPKSQQNVLYIVYNQSKMQLIVSEYKISTR